MNCDRCPHMKKIRAALAPCQNCDAGKLHGQVSSDAASNADLVYAHRTDSTIRHSSTDGVTNLPPDIEERLRIAMAQLFELDPIKFLLVRHIVNGGGYSSFRRDLRRLVHSVIDRDYDLSENSSSFRSICQQWGNIIRGQFDAFAAVAPQGKTKQGGNCVEGRYS